MIRILFSLMMLFAIGNLPAQHITLEECLIAAEKNYPLSKNRSILEALGDFNIQNAFAGKQPQVNLVAQATYQSDVTRIPIDAPQFKVPVVAKDQYRTYAELTQSLIDGGSSNAAAGLQKRQTELDQKNLEVELYKLRERVAQLYFGALLSGRQIEQTELLILDQEAVLKKLDQSVQEGVVLRLNADQIRAEKIRTLQRKLEQSGMRKIYIQALGLLTGLDLMEDVILKEPQIQETIYGETHRPEIGLYETQSDFIRQQLNLTLSRNTPKAGFFLQAGFGRPGLNLLLNEFDTYYLAGLRFNWNLSGFWTNKNERQIAQSRMNMIDIQREVFRLNNRIQQQQYLEETSRLYELIRLDEELIVLRKRILETVKVQLDNGVVTASDYIRESNAMDQARLSLVLHQIQRTQSAFYHRQLLGD